jgi:hypothetical protein
MQFTLIPVLARVARRPAAMRAPPRSVGISRRPSTRVDDRSERGRCRLAGRRRRVSYGVGEPESRFHSPRRSKTPRSARAPARNAIPGADKLGTAAGA